MYLWEVYFVNIKEREYLGSEMVIAESDQNAGVFAIKEFENKIDKASQDILWKNIKAGEVKVYPKMILQIDSWKEK